LSYGADCISHASCNDTKGLMCTDYGCDCGSYDKYWNPILENCVTEDLLCTTSVLMCGSCIKQFETSSTFADAATYCNTTDPEFRNLQRIRNAAQWLYLKEKDGTDQYWVSILRLKIEFIS
jgi:hypothetical protein